MTDSASAIGEFSPFIEEALSKACDFGPSCPDRLAEAMRYSVLAPGKRLRPALVLIATEACGGDPAQALGPAVAVEMIHAYSLIHDDLPAMDDDDLRRGRPTTHIQFDEATAILAGDALQAEAFRILAESIPDPSKAIEAVITLAKAAGAAALVGGQADDLAAETGGPRTLAHLEHIHRRKTGALFSASLELGAIVSGASVPLRLALSDYARDLGLAFQAVDDLLDSTSSDSSLGKRAGKDADRGKLTYPGLLGIEETRSKARQLVESSRRHVSVFGAAGWRLTWLAGYVLERTH
jgi:geranylgeranyl diphosphate synthase, type II